jgi:dihydrofolate synthase / folylpolyglutamate synthase
MNHSETYQHALDFLYSFVDYSLTRSFQNHPEAFDLSRMEKLLDLLGNPHRQYRVIHLTGTKGKGSTAALIASVLRTGGYRVGFYTSPHLQEFNERIQINEKMIPDERIVTLVEKLKKCTSRIDRLTTFELTTALAFEYFAEENVDVAVVEVGLGGRLDATNLVDPVLSIITSISYDHMAVLGNTLEKIAFEKAGIIKAGKPVITALQKREAFEVIRKIADEKGSRLIQVGEDYRFADFQHSLKEQSLHIWKADEQPLMNVFINQPGFSEWKPTNLTIPLLGYHQVENAAVAYSALQIADQCGLKISLEDIKKGFREVFWPCRFEVLRQEPPVIVDSAHNRDSALKLRLTIEDYLAGRPVILLFGASEDKDILGMFYELLPRVREVVVTESIHPRAMEAAKLESMALRFAKPVHVAVPVEAALDTALKLAKDDACVVAAGSLFVAAGVRQAWEKTGTGLRSFELAVA